MSEQIKLSQQADRLEANETTAKNFHELISQGSYFLSTQQRCKIQSV